MLALLLALPTAAEAVDRLVGPTQTYPTISAAVAAANPYDRVLVDPGTYVDAIVVDGLPLEIVGGPGVVLQPPASIGNVIFHATGGADLHVQDLQIDCMGVEAQAAVVDASRLTGQGLAVSSCGAGGEGAVLARTKAVLELESSRFDGNTTGEIGADLVVQDATAHLTDVELVGGSAGNGGSIYVSGGTLELVDARIRDASAYVGGALVAWGATVLIEDSRIEGTTTTGGGALHLYDTALTLRRSTLEANTSSDATLKQESGGSAVVVDSHFLSNDPSGPLMYLVSLSAAEVGGNVFCANTSGARSIKFSSTPGLFRNNVVLGGYTSTYGVSAYGSASIVDVVNNHFVGNTSGGSGSALTTESGGTLTAVNNLVAYHRDSYGGAVWGSSGPLDFGWGLLYDNLPQHTDVVTLHDSLVDVDPGFAYTAGSCSVYDLLPPAGSAAVDAGDPAILDADGSPSDIGAFGGPQPNTLIDWPDADGDGVTEDLDCDDTRAEVAPGLQEVPCDGLDNDCDGTVDPGGTLEVFADADGDGFGAGPPVSVCTVEPGFSTESGDCDDTKAQVFPGADERCNGLDDDCDAELDEQPVDGISVYADADGDGFGAGAAVTACDVGPGFAAEATDCDDTDAEVHPAAAEERDDGIDQDCDGNDLKTSLDGRVGIACGHTPGAGWLPALLLLLGYRRRGASTTLTA